jgi:murein DD-endopeptidase / murein LD-carboxypeptidase
MVKFLFISFLIICSSTSFSQDSLDTVVKENRNTAIDSILMTSLSEYGIDKQLIVCYPMYTKIIEWMGIPYSYGGNSKKSIDCSNLVIQLTNDIYYNSISGNAATLYEASHKLKRQDLSEGDLVFFKINKSYVSHVGVYLQNDLFVHATRGKGVLISSLNESYYKKHFFGSGRFMDYDH